MLLYILLYGWASKHPVNIGQCLMTSRPWSLKVNEGEDGFFPRSPSLSIEVQGRDSLAADERRQGGVHLLHGGNLTV